MTEVLVGFKDSTILKLPTNHIFQSAMSTVIVNGYVNSAFVVLVPLYGC